MISIELPCPKCTQTERVCKNGRSTSGHQRYRCMDCEHTFRFCRKLPQIRYDH